MDGMHGDRSALVGPLVGNDGTSAQGVDAVCLKQTKIRKCRLRRAYSYFVNENEPSLAG